jgi:hypothetical protein
MKSALLFFTILLFFLLSNLSFAWDSTAAKFYPLAIGNLWSYRFVQYTQGSCVPINSYDYIISIVSDTVMPNNKKYFKFSNGSLERIDSSTMNVYKYISHGNEILLDSLLSKKNDYFRGSRFGTSYNYQVVDTTPVNFTNQLWRCKMIRYWRIGDFHYKLLHGIGLYFIVSCELGGYHITLNGCIINGVQYGTIVRIKNINTGIPAEFSLYQNYPNPFNPITKIQFALPKNAFAKLIIYDVLGREVETLVNEQLAHGTYEVSWDATNYPSGVYFYRLTAGEYIETRRMILIK